MTDLSLKLCDLLDERLRSEERRRRVVSLLAGGAAFESWLAFETRLLAETHRAELGLAETIDERGATLPRYSIVNEHRKVDLCILDGGDPAADPLLTLEFKLIHNNKNWEAKCDEVREDLFPTGKIKSAMHPRLGRYAAVGVVGLVYDDPASMGYPGQIENLATWKVGLAPRLLRPAGRNQPRAVELWQGNEVPVDDPWIRKGCGAFFRLHLLGTSAQ